jgi:integral membrane protein (TIGR01906 family)
MPFKNNSKPIMHNPVKLVSLILASLSFFLSLNLLLLARSESMYQVLAQRAYHEQLISSERMQLGSHIQQALINKSSIQFYSSNGSVLFNSREVVHMQDVAGLLQLAFFWMLFSALLLILGIKASIPLSLSFCKKIGWGSMTILLLSGLAIFLFFSPLFHLFHVFSFSNDFWLLDPKTDFLIRLFPMEFFQIALIWIYTCSMLLSIFFWLVLPRFLIRKSP